MKRIALGDALADVGNGLTVKQSNDLGGTPISRIETISTGEIDPDRVGYAGINATSHAKWLLKPGDILFSHINSFEHVGKCAIYQSSPRELIHGMNLLRLRPDTRLIHPKYLLYALRAPEFRSSMQPYINRAVNQASISIGNLKQVEVPLPDMDEQLHVVTMLDEADGLRAKRRQAISLLDDLAQAIFHDMFGNSGVDGSAWPVEPISAHLAEEARNGLSPSKGGGFENLVLTLSAITGGAFDKNAVKLGTFKRQPPASKRVDHRDFFVCRGNGNLNLVGLGCFPDGDMPETVFPDTMIALRVDPGTIGREYLEYVWGVKPVRTQIEAGARTTNGTFKINQGVVESIRIPIPPIRAQEDFGQRIRSLKMIQEQQSRDLTVLDELFASLQFRAFRGEL